jgi:hypothetical protein
MLGQDLGQDPLLGLDLLQTRPPAGGENDANTSRYRWVQLM